jgi:large repetitive protein
VDLATLDSNAQWFGSTLPVTTTCNENLVEWRYGNQFLQSYNPADYPEYGGLFPIELTFVARVQNSAATAHGATLTNPGGVAQMTYEDQNGNPQQPAVFE